ncbi:uracil phosphoribosyltransferase [Flavobacterium sp. MAH-1]|uniref:Uracil phosphoribosyltransferase n=1 Tax=Flavobacterium agri TaxID=2743471 RepID=A0A7Y8Y0L5_9FLAO|nr:uracil phosphoribosyltransferase [Flavobacterium agri]NUY80152.1 uracil phosphoribosyltransferase [Flavobacterium agri]NYA70177.1 uracil phosphoribosyltransferase [Flavobacterium agri]
MHVRYLSENHSILSHFLAQIRNVDVQKDSMRFRRNIERIGEIMAYEISKELEYKTIEIKTPLATKKTAEIETPIVLCSVLRAGLPLHIGFLNYFDDAQNGFISAYRHHYKNDDDFEIKVEYRAMPSIEGKTLVIVDPMLATGQSLAAVLEILLQSETPAQVHIAAVIAAPEGIALLEEKLPENFYLWIAAQDERLNEKNYIVPGLGDAGDLAYGPKL